MSILVIEEAAEAAEWARHLRKELPDAEIRVWPDVPDPDAVEMAVVWDNLDALVPLARLRALVVLGAGVDHLLERRDALPQGVPCLRIVDDSVRAQMVEWVLLALLTHLRRWDEYRDLQRRGRYEELPVPVPSEVVVGIMGFGVLGRAAGETLRSIGYRVRGWSRSPKQVAGIECFAGEGELGSFLAGCDVLVCMLPLTAQTESLFGREVFALMKRGAYFINAARGGHVVEADLVAAIDEGRLSGATLWTCSARSRCRPVIPSGPTPESASRRTSRPIPWPVSAPLRSRTTTAGCNAETRSLHRVDLRRQY